MASVSGKARDEQAGAVADDGWRQAVRLAWGALAEWASPVTNPFLARELRRDARSQIPLRTLAVAVVVLILAAEAWSSWAPASFDAVNAKYSLLKLPPWCGHNLFGLIALVVSGVSAYVVSFRSGAGVARLLKDEVDRATLTQLQMLPVPEERWLWQMSAHPLALGVLIALCGLPVYCLAIAADTWSPMDVAGLTLVYVWLAYKVPPWQPMAWMTSATKKPAEMRKMRARWRELNRDVDTASMSAVQLMEHNRRMQRAMASGELLDGGAAAGTEPGTGTRAEPSGRRAAGAAPKPARQSGQASGNRAATGVLFYIVVLVVSSTFWLSSPVAALAMDVARWFPASVSDLYDSFPISWPLMIARLILTPLPLLAFRVPPILLLVPLAYQGNRYRNIMLASRVSVADSFWTPQRLQVRKSSARWLDGLWTLLVLGYCWRGLMFDGEISHLIRGTVPGIDSALAALWTLFLCIGSLLAANACRRHFAFGARGGEALRRAWRLSMNAIANTFEFAILGYFGLCWLGGSSGGSALWLARLVPTLCIASSFCLVVLGAEALGATLDHKTRRFWRFALMAWFLLPVAEALGRELILLNEYGTMAAPISIFARAPHQLISPLVSLFGIFRLNLSSGLAWWIMPLVQGAIGGICLGLAAPTIFADAGTPQVSLSRRLAQAVKAPFVAAYAWIIGIRWAPVMLLVAGAWAVGRALWQAGHFLNKWVVYLTAWPQRAVLRLVLRSDNPVLAAEMKTMIHGDSWSTQLAILNIAGVACILMVQPWTLRPLDYANAGHTIMTLALMVISVLCVVKFLSIQRVFDRDRINGTLVFLFLTPMTDRQILAGKLVPPLLLATGYWTAAVVPMIFGGALAWAGGDVYSMVWGADVLCLIFSALLLLSCMWLLYAAGHNIVTRTISLGAVVLVGAGIDFGCMVAALENWQPFTVTLLTLSLVAVILSMAYGFWRGAIGAMAASRYGDVTEQGKGAN